MLNKSQFAAALIVLFFQVLMLFWLQIKYNVENQSVYY